MGSRAHGSMSIQLPTHRIGDELGDYYKMRFIEAEVAPSTRFCCAGLNQTKDSFSCRSVLH